MAITACNKVILYSVYVSHKEKEYLRQHAERRMFIFFFASCSFSSVLNNISEIVGRERLIVCVCVCVCALTQAVQRRGLNMKTLARI